MALFLLTVTIPVLVQRLAINSCLNLCLAYVAYLCTLNFF